MAHAVKFKSVGPSSGRVLNRRDDPVIVKAMPKLLLIRHCETIGRQPDAPLSEAGAKAAETLVTRLHDLAPDASTPAPMNGRTRQFAPSRSRLDCQSGSMIGFASAFSRIEISQTDWTTSAARSPSRTTVRAVGEPQ